MGLINSRWWRFWRRRWHRRTALRLMERQQRVLREGISIRARVDDFYDTGRTINGLRLFRVRISIRFPDGVQVQVLSSTLAATLSSGLRNCTVRMKILAGDLHHIVILP